MPNTAVDMNSWAVSACYPRSTFYPLSDGPSIQNHRITMTCFRTCSRRHARSQAGLCHCTNLLMSDQISQPSCSSVTLWEETAPVKLPTRHCPQPGSRVYVRTPAIKGWYFKMAPRRLASTLQSLPPILHIKDQCSVSSYSKGSRGLSVLPRVHCIFTASSISLSLGWRQPAIITPFVQVGTYPTRNFATLGPL